MPTSDNDNLPSLDALKSKIEAAQKAEGDQASTRTMSLMMRLVVDLMAGVLVGCAIGYFLDRAFDTAPWLLVAFFFLGSAAGMRNMWRTAQRMETELKKE